MSKPIKILELSKNQFLAPLSYRLDEAVGGVFESVANVNPFVRYGELQEVRDKTSLGSGTITTPILDLNTVNLSGVPTFYAHGNAKLYTVNTLSDAITDVTSQVTAGTTFRGATVYKNRYIYAIDTQVRGNTIPVASGSDVQLIASVEASDHPMTIGADLNLYFPNGNKIGKITNIAGTSGNTDNVFALEEGMNIRHLINDGRYLVILADDNTSKTIGRFRAVVAYWDYTSANLTQRFDFEESFLIGGYYLKNQVYVIGRDAKYTTNVATAPQVVMPFTGRSTITQAAISPQAIAVLNGYGLWGTNNGTNDGFVYGYGNIIPGARNVLFNNYRAKVNCLAFNGLQVWGGAADENRLYKFDVGNAISGTQWTTTTFKLPRPYQFEYIKVVLSGALISGQSVTISARTTDDQVLVNAVQKSFSNSGAKKNLIFNFEGFQTKAYFDDLRLDITTNAPTDQSNRVSIQRIEVWATPLENYQSLI